MAAAPKVTLTYFETEGRAEIIRWTLSVGGVEFEDKRITKEEFAALKPELPQGMLPVLSIGDAVIPQSYACLRAAAKLGGLYPDDVALAGQVDGVLGGAVDFASEFIRGVVYETDEERKKANMRKFMTVTQPKWLAIFNSQIKANGTGFVVGDKLTVADIQLGFLCDRISSSEHLGGFDKEAYPELAALTERVTALDAIVAWKAAHPRAAAAAGEKK